MREQIGTLRTDIQEQSGGTVAGAGERGARRRTMSSSLSKNFRLRGGFTDIAGTALSLARPSRPPPNWNRLLDYNLLFN